MSKMQYFGNKFLKIAKPWGFSAPALIILQCCDLKLCDLAKLWIFKLILTKLNF